MIVLDPGKLYDIGGVIAWMGVSRRWFYRNHRALVLRGFPFPIHKPGRARWRGETLIAWSRADAAKEAAFDAPGTNVVDLGAIAAQRSKALMGRRKAS